MLAKKGRLQSRDFQTLIGTPENLLVVYVKKSLSCYQRDFFINFILKKCWALQSNASNLINTSSFQTFSEGPSVW